MCSSAAHCLTKHIVSRTLSSAAISNYWSVTFSLGMNLNHTGAFIHTNITELSFKRSLSFSTASNSNSQKILAITNLNSIKAKFLPIHARGPIENGILALRASLFSLLSISSHLSGINLPGLWKFWGLWQWTYCGEKHSVPAGTYLPSTIAPGDSRMPKVTRGGKSRSDSEITALM